MYTAVSDINVCMTIYSYTVALIKSASRKSICLQTLKVGANDRSAQELQNGL